MILGAAVPFIILYIHRYSAQSERKVSALERLKDIASTQDSMKSTLDGTCKDVKSISEKVNVMAEKLGIIDFRVKSVEAELDRRKTP